MIRRKRKAIVKVVVITHYPSALRDFIAAAEHYDRVAPGWGQLVLFDSAQRLQKDDEQGLREAVETAGCVVVDLMIKLGFYADVTVVKMDGPQYVCDATNLPEFLVYAGSSRDVAATIVAGKVLYDGGTFTTLDRDRILSETSRYRYEITRG